jgi:hypothetical protein
VTVDIDDALGLGAQFYRWQLATAAAGHVLEIDPFNEPNVAESKANTAKVLAALPLPSLPVRAPSELWSWLTKVTGDGDYVSLQAYLPYASPTPTELDALRRQVRDRLSGMAVTAGYGPRFLHSTGQLHKGGPPSVVAVQLVRRTPSAKLDIPGFDYDFATLIAAQSIGDHESLFSHGRRVVRIALDDLAELG